MSSIAKLCAFSDCSLPRRKGSNRKYCTNHEQILHDHHRKDYTSAEYQAWVGMKGRCYNRNNREYKYYGYRGIRVCDKWLWSFVDFFLDMGPRPTPFHSLDRENGDKNYEPGNCRWVTRSLQSYNVRILRPGTSKYRGVCRDHDKWRATIDHEGRQHFLGLFVTEEDAAVAYNQAAISLWGLDAKLNDVT